MLESVLTRIVDFCSRRPWPVLAASLALTVIASFYVGTNFAINTDISRLISEEPQWRQNQLAFEKAFPTNRGSMIAVLDGPSPEVTEEAARRLAAAAAKEKAHINSVRLLTADDFLLQNGLLYLPPNELNETLEQLGSSGRLLGPMAQDPSLRGIMDAIALSLRGVQARRVKLDDLAPQFNAFSGALEDAFKNRPSSFSWRSLIGEQNGGGASQLRQVLDIDPVLNYDALKPGEDASEAVRRIAHDLKLAQSGVKVRLTGTVPVSDEEFGTLEEDAGLHGTLTVGSVLIILWLALHSMRIIGAVFAALVAGLAWTAAIGLALVDAFNPISVAFFVLFVGIGVDFGLQFSVAYRAERYLIDNLHEALVATARTTGSRLALAALATAAGFMSFLPTAYKGLSELGQVAGVGMLIAFLTSITVLPALLSLVKPPAEPENPGYAFLLPVDRFLERNRMPVLVWTLIIVVVGSPLLYFVRFDFNPMNLRSKKVESVSTYFDLRRDPLFVSNAEVLVPSLAKAQDLAKELMKLPEVSQARTLASLIPEDQDSKLAQIAQAKARLDPILNPAQVSPPPTDQEVVESIGRTANLLNTIARSRQGEGADAAKKLANLLNILATAHPEVRVRAANTLILPLNVTLEDLRKSLSAHKITEQTIPHRIKADWVTSDGKARVSVAPKQDLGDNTELAKFSKAVLKVAPDATGEPIVIQKSGEIIIWAFAQAAAWALLSIALLLWITLRRIFDVLVTLIPLLLAGLVTMELTVLVNLPLNYANIIALPLLLGVGVAFKIYYVMAWREGKSNLLSSSLTRAVFFSGMTTAVAFGSLWLSAHPGTSSMGELLALSLISTMAAATLFQPLLMGPTRATESEAPAEKELQHSDRP